MNKIDKVFLEAYNIYKPLKKVRLKIDPLNINLKDYTHLNGYEGYILNEHIDSKTVDVLLVGDELKDPFLNGIPNDCIDKSSILDNLTKFKIAAKLYLEKKLNVDNTNQIYNDIDNAINLNNIEKKLSIFGLNKKAIFEIYKLYVLTNEPI